MTKFVKYIFIITIFLLAYNSLSAQLDSVMNDCEKYLNEEFISDGQQYLSLITSDQVAEFSVIFYGGNTYRVISCGGNNNINFVVFDKFRNELFRSSEYNNTNFWDFQIESTIECFVEAKFSSKSEKSGFAVLLIGLKK